MSQFSEAIIGSLSASLSPEAGMVKAYGEQQIKLVEINVAERTLGIVEQLEVRISQALENNADGRVVEGYQRMLKQFTS